MDIDFQGLVTPIKTYWILDGDSKAYDMREEIKAWAGYFVREHKAWCIDDPCELSRKALTSLGLILQFRRYKESK